MIYHRRFPRSKRANQIHTVTLLQDNPKKKETLQIPLTELGKHLQAFMQGAHNFLGFRGSQSGGSSFLKASNWIVEITPAITDKQLVWFEEVGMGFALTPGSRPPENSVPKPKSKTKEMSEFLKKIVRKQVETQRKKNEDADKALGPTDREREEIARRKYEQKRKERHKEDKALFLFAGFASLSLMLLAVTDKLHSYFKAKQPLKAMDDLEKSMQVLSKSPKLFAKTFAELHFALKKASETKEFPKSYKLLDKEYVALFQYVKPGSKLETSIKEARVEVAGLGNLVRTSKYVVAKSTHPGARLPRNTKVANIEGVKQNMASSLAQIDQLLQKLTVLLTSATNQLPEKTDKGHTTYELRASRDSTRKALGVCATEVRRFQKAIHASLPKIKTAAKLEKEANHGYYR